jgi:hypothetical protein
MTELGSPNFAYLADLFNNIRIAGNGKKYKLRI